MIGALAGASLAVMTSSCTPSRSRTPRPFDRALARERARGFLSSRLVSVAGFRGISPAIDSAVIALTDADTRRVAVYDSALVALVLARSDARPRAADVLAGLLAIQHEDGSLPFSFELPLPPHPISGVNSTPRYVRSGAVAWVGYAAAEYLDADRDGPLRGEILLLARRAADYLMKRQVDAPTDPRDGLVRGGEGVYRYESGGAKSGGVREVLYRDDIEWTSVEHNVDTAFFFRAMARVTGDTRYREAHQKIERALRRLWIAEQGQLARGATKTAADPVLALDCASWGAVLLGAIGDKAHADRSSAVADDAYATYDKRRDVWGHRAQLRGAVLEGEALVRSLGPKLPARDWSELRVVWPEGSAGVALAALRAGRGARAQTILDELESLRTTEGALPTATLDVPFLFDTKPSIAGTAWVELVRFELNRPVERPTLWTP